MYVKFTAARLVTAHESYPYPEVIVENVTRTEYERVPDGTAWMRLHFEEGKESADFDLRGPAYVMNDQGKTINSFEATPPVCIAFDDFSAGPRGIVKSSSSFLDREMKHQSLRRAVRRLYYAAYWKADRKVDEDKLWTAVRDAAGFKPGTARDVLGDPRWEAPSSPPQQEEGMTTMEQKMLDFAAGKDVGPFPRDGWIVDHTASNHSHDGMSHYEMPIYSWEQAAQHILKYHPFTLTEEEKRKLAGPGA